MKGLFAQNLINAVGKVFGAAFKICQFLRHYFPADIFT